MRQAGYFTADEAVYSKGVNALYLEMLQKVRNVPDPVKADVDWDSIRAMIPHLDFDWGIYEEERRADSVS